MCLCVVVALCFIKRSSVWSKYSLGWRCADRVSLSDWCSFKDTYLTEADEIPQKASPTAKTQRRTADRCMFSMIHETVVLFPSKAPPPKRPKNVLLVQLVLTYRASFQAKTQITMAAFVKPVGKGSTFPGENVLLTPINGYPDKLQLDKPTQKQITSAFICALLYYLTG